MYSMKKYISWLKTIVSLTVWISHKSQKTHFWTQKQGYTDGWRPKLWSPSQREVLHPVGLDYPSSYRCQHAKHDIHPLQCIIQKNESPDVHSLGLDVLVILLNVKSSYCIAREKNSTIQRLFGSLLRAYGLPQTAKPYHKKQVNIRRQCHKKNTGVNKHIPTENKRAVNSSTVAS